MISFRSHVVSLVAVFLALAVGIVLGAGPLQREDGGAGSGDSDAEALAAADARIEDLEEATAFADAYARGTSDLLVGGEPLRRRAVTVVTLPGADDDEVTRAQSAVQDAGGVIAARVELTDKLLDVANRKLVEELTAQVVAENRRLPGAQERSGYARFGALLGLTLATAKDDGATPPQVARSVMASLTTAGLVDVTGEVQRAGSLVLLVAGPPAGTADQRRGAGDIVTAVARALDRAGDGVALLGPRPSSEEDGVLAALRGSPTAQDVSSVDVADLAAGATLTVVALAREAFDSTVHVGTSRSADGAWPAAEGAEQ